MKLMLYFQLLELSLGKKVNYVPGSKEQGAPTLSKTVQIFATI